MKKNELMKKNQKFIQIPMPDLSNITIEDLEKRYELLSKAYDDAFEKDDADKVI